MKTTLKLGFALLICAVSVQASEGYLQPDDKKTGASAEGPAVLVGCLQRSEGEYTLTDRTNTLYHLSGGSKLKSHIGHEVELTGTPTTQTIDTTPPGAASSVIQRSVFRVKTVKDVAATCQSGAR